LWRFLCIMLDVLALDDQDGEPFRIADSHPTVPRDTTSSLLHTQKTKRVGVERGEGEKTGEGGREGGREERMRERERID